MFHDLVIGEDEGVTKRSARKSACAKAVIYSKDNILELSDICTCTEIVENLDVLNQEAEEDC